MIRLDILQIEQKEGRLLMVDEDWFAKLKYYLVLPIMDIHSYWAEDMEC